MKVLFAAAEAAPFAKAGGLGDVAAALPRALRKAGVDARLIIPFYRSVMLYPGIEVKNSGQDGHANLHNVPKYFYIKQADCGGLPVYFVDMPAFFNREHIYGYFDDVMRFTAFSRAILEFIRNSDWKLDVLHCNDWHTALIPAFMDTIYSGEPSINRIATVFTIHNLAHQGVFPSYYMDAIGLPPSEFDMHRLEFHGKLNLMKAGIFHSGRVSTVSPTYSREILSPEYGEGLDAMLCAHSGKLSGIINGIDTSKFNPEIDPAINAHYSPDAPDARSENKTALLSELGLPVDGKGAKAPLIGMVTRITDQKGFSLIEQALPALLKLNIKVAVLGSGDSHFEKMLASAAEAHPDRLAVRFEFNEPLARRIYAGSDIFLMPSRFEPCGLGQMIAMRYGAAPLVRATGGLADTVRNFNTETLEGNGFSFEEYSAGAMMLKLKEALAAFKSKKKWQSLISNAMKECFSWDSPAEEYISLFNLAVAQKTN